MRQQMSQPTLQDNIQQQSDSELDCEYIHINDEDDDDWQDAEEEQQPSSSEDLPTSSSSRNDTTTAVPNNTAATTPANKEPEQKITIDETELRKKIKEIQLNKDLTSREKAKQIQV
jgi:hypothetical protein